MEFLEEIKAAEEQAARQRQEALAQAKSIRQTARLENQREVRTIEEESKRQVQAIRQTAQLQAQRQAQAAREQREAACSALAEQAKTRMNQGLKTLLSLLEQPLEK